MYTFVNAAMSFEVLVFADFVSVNTFVKLPIFHDFSLEWVQ